MRYAVLAAVLAAVMLVLAGCSGGDSEVVHYGYKGSLPGKCGSGSCN